MTMFQTQPSGMTVARARERAAADVLRMAGRLLSMPGVRLPPAPADGYGTPGEFAIDWACCDMRASGGAGSLARDRYRNELRSRIGWSHPTGLANRRDCARALSAARRALLRGW